MPSDPTLWWRTACRRLTSLRAARSLSGVRAVRHGVKEAAGEAALWGDDELTACGLGPRHLLERLRRLRGQLAEAIGQPLPLVRWDLAGSLSGHFAAMEAFPPFLSVRAGDRSGREGLRLSSRQPCRAGAQAG